MGAVESSSERRQEAVRLLAIMESGCRYARHRLSNGAGAAEAAEIVEEMAGELELAALAMWRAGAPVSERPAVRRRVVRSSGRADVRRSTARRARARKMAALGAGTREIALSLGVSQTSVREYLRSGGLHGDDVGLAVDGDDEHGPAADVELPDGAEVGGVEDRGDVLRGVEG